MVTYPDPSDLTPWELRDGMWYKREDLHRNAYGVNGAKFRACRHMLTKARAAGYRHVVSAQSVLSPQSSICATLCEELDLGCTIVVGASKPESAAKHANIAIALRAGAILDTTPRVAYNGVIQPYARDLAFRLDAWQLPYAISLPEDASSQDLRDFLGVNGVQVTNLPGEVRTIVIAFGSGNTTAGLLYGLSRFGRGNVERVVLVGVGPDRSAWLKERLARAGASEIFNEIKIHHIPLHPWYAVYGDKMPETSDEIVMHPTYEGKVIRYLNEQGHPWWTARDGSVGFWIVGGPL